MRSRFGMCIFDSGTRQLWCREKIVSLSPKGLDLLELLLERAPNAVSKDEIQASLWPDTFVSEASLTSLISDIRAAVGDRASEPRFIRTVHRFGYAFSGEAVEEPVVTAHGSLESRLYRVVLANRKFPLSEGENVLGRHPDARVQIDQAAISRQHARISIREGLAVLEDLESRNGTFLNDRRLRSSARLKDGDVIRLGPVSMTFRIFASPDSTEAVGDR